MRRRTTERKAPSQVRLCFRLVIRHARNTWDNCSSLPAVCHGHLSSCLESCLSCRPGLSSFAATISSFSPSSRPSLSKASIITLTFLAQHPPERLFREAAPIAHMTRPVSSFFSSASASLRSKTRTKVRPLSRACAGRCTHCTRACSVEISDVTLSRSRTAVTFSR